MAVSGYPLWGCRFLFFRFVVSVPGATDRSEDWKTMVVAVRVIPPRLLSLSGPPFRPRHGFLAPTEKNDFDHGSDAGVPFSVQ